MIPSQPVPLSRNKVHWLAQLSTFVYVPSNATTPAAAHSQVRLYRIPVLSKNNREMQLLVSGVFDSDDG